MPDVDTPVIKDNPHNHRRRTNPLGRACAVGSNDMPLGAARLAEEKLLFLRKFSLSAPMQSDWKRRALRDATTASGRRGRLYRKGLTKSQRDVVHEGWWEQLERLAENYVVKGPAFATTERFEQDILELRASMNP
jgi:hypothetical protein